MGIVDAFSREDRVEVKFRTLRTYEAGGRSMKLL